MGIDTNLYLSLDYSLEDIADVLKHTQKCDVKIEACNNQPNCYRINLAKRSIFCVTPTNTPIGNATYLNLYADDEAHKIFTDIAEVLGGLFRKFDYDNKCELIQGKLSPEDSLPYFLRYAVIHDGIEPDDLQGLIDSIKNWYNKVDSTNHDELRQLANKWANK